MPKFEELPFNARPDLSPYLIHLTKNTNAEDKYSAFENLASILRTGVIQGSSSKTGFIKGPKKATCFMDVPFASLKYVLTPENSDPQNPRYEAYGIVIGKDQAYRKGCRPVLYLSNEEVKAIGVPRGELWRVVRFETERKSWISWLHEREWRVEGSFRLPSRIDTVLVKTAVDARRLQKQLAAEPGTFKCKPRSVIPLEVLCQGFLR